MFLMFGVPVHSVTEALTSWLIFEDNDSEHEYQFTPEALWVTCSENPVPIPAEKQEPPTEHVFCFCFAVFTARQGGAPKIKVSKINKTYA